MPASNPDVETGLRSRGKYRLNLRNAAPLFGISVMHHARRLLKAIAGCPSLVRLSVVAHVLEGVGG